MRIVSFVGVSDSGKTRLIMRLVEEFNRRGLQAGVIKHCHQGFDLDLEEKDTSRFWDKGAAGVALLSPSRWAVIKRMPPEKSAVELAKQVFADQDVVLVEGGKHDRGIPMIAVERPGRRDRISLNPTELAAVVCEEDISLGKPVFHPDQIQVIADFILNILNEVEI